MKKILYLLLFSIFLLFCQSSDSKKNNKNISAQKNNTRKDSSLDNKKDDIYRQKKSKRQKFTRYLLDLVKLNNNQNNFTIHGLWPDMGTCTVTPVETNCTECFKGRFTVDMNKDIKDLKEKMNTFWLAKNKDNKGFWSYQYYKHGSCSGLIPYDYFKKTIELFEREKRRCQNDWKRCRIYFDYDFNYLMVKGDA